MENRLILFLFFIFKKIKIMPKYIYHVYWIGKKKKKKRIEHITCIWRRGWVLESTLYVHVETSNNGIIWHGTNAGGAAGNRHQSTAQGRGGWWFRVVEGCMWEISKEHMEWWRPWLFWCSAGLGWAGLGAGFWIIYPKS